MQNEKGFSLFEVLIAISVFAVIGVLASQLIGVSLTAERQSGNRSVALELAQGASEAVDAIATESWHNVYLLSKGQSNHYYPVVSGSKWATSTGDELVTIDGTQYRRYFFVENVARDGSGNIADAGTDDPSTQKVTIVSSWEDSGGLTLGTATTTKYLLRARNTAASQTSWSGATGPTSGETGTFGDNYAAQSNMDTSGGSLQLTP